MCSRRKEGDENGSRKEGGGREEGLSQEKMVGLMDRARVI